MTYKVKVTYTVEQYWKVFATTEEEALDKVLDGDAILEDEITDELEPETEVISYDI